MKKIFYNAEEARFRAGWRILAFIVLFWTCAAAVFAVKPLLGDITRREFMGYYGVLVIGIIALGATITVPLARRYFDKRPLVSLGLALDRRTLPTLVFGFLLSGAMAGLVYLLMLGLGAVELNGLNLGRTFEHREGAPGFIRFMSTVSAGAILVLLLETVLVGYWEELVFRGYLLQNMIDGMGLKIAIAASCLVYGLVHAMNPNAGLLSCAIIVLFGFMRLYGYLATRLLWLSMGMHIGWNFFQGPVFGFAASGHAKISVMNITPTGPDWLSGGAFGPEGSVLIIPVVGLAMLAMRWWANKTAP